MSPDNGWRELAACRGTDPNWWFPERGEPTHEQKAICDSCPVCAECLEDALATSEKHGIRGGTSERGRRRLRYDHRARLSNRAPARCGTPSGYKRHRALGEDACPACRAANTAATIAYKRAHA